MWMRRPARGMRQRSTEQGSGCAAGGQRHAEIQADTVPPTLEKEQIVVFERPDSNRRLPSPDELK